MPRGIPDAMRVDTQDTGRMSEAQIQASIPRQPVDPKPRRKPVGGVVLLAIGLVLGVGLPWQDPSASCAAGHALHSAVRLIGCMVLVPRW